MPSGVTIILPTYNRARFLPEAFASIQAQTYAGWDLVVVDDGSTDSTPEIVERWRRQVPQDVQYVRQANGGAYAARNTGLDRVRAPLVAFFDSDDVWRPHHLQQCVGALAAVPSVDWVFAACEMVDASGRVVQSSTFLDHDGRPHAFLELDQERHGDLHVIVDPTAIECLLDSGIYCGLQNSVIRARVFEGQRFWEDYRVVEDSQFLLRALVRGMRLGYLTDVQVVYRMHDENSSASAAGGDRRQIRRVIEEKVRGLERLNAAISFTTRQQAAMNRNLAREYFWRLGYACCWETGDRTAALTAMQKALRLTPFDLRMAKTYAACLARTKLRIRRVEALR